MQPGDPRLPRTTYVGKTAGPPVAAVEEEASHLFARAGIGSGFCFLLVDNPFW